MPKQPMTASEWAAQVDPRHVSFAAIEGRAAEDAGDTSGEGSCASVIVEGVAWLAPLVGAALFMVSGTRVLEMEPIEAPVAVPVAGILFAVATLGPLMTLLRWRRRGRRRSGFTLAPNVWTLVLSTIGGVALALRAQQGGMEPGLWGAVPWVAAALAVLAIGVQLIASAPPRDPAVQARIDAETLRRRAEALAILRDRGAIDEATHARATALPLGELRQLDREKHRDPLR